MNRLQITFIISIIQYNCRLKILKKFEIIIDVLSAKLCDNYNRIVCKRLWIEGVREQTYSSENKGSGQRYACKI